MDLRRDTNYKDIYREMTFYAEKFRQRDVSH